MVRPRSHIRNSIITLLICFSSSFATAGVMELSGSYGIRTTSIDADNYSKTETWSGSFAWYFLEMSALELSYTKGQSTQSLKALTDPAPLVYYTIFEMYGADLVITLAKKTSFIQPFIRGGVAQLKKEMFRKDINGDIDEFGEPIDRVVPSYGGGIKIKITETLSIKGSYDRWKSGSTDTKDIWDDAIKAGISWYF